MVFIYLPQDGLQWRGTKECLDQGPALVVVVVEPRIAIQRLVGGHAILKQQ